MKHSPSLQTYQHIDLSVNNNYQTKTLPYPTHKSRQSNTSYDTASLRSFNSISSATLSTKENKKSSFSEDNGSSINMKNSDSSSDLGVDVSQQQQQQQHQNKQSNIMENYLILDRLNQKQQRKQQQKLKQLDELKQKQHVLEQKLLENQKSKY